MAFIQDMGEFNLVFFHQLHLLQPVFTQLYVHPVQQISSAQTESESLIEGNMKGGHANSFLNVNKSICHISGERFLKGS